MYNRSKRGGGIRLQAIICVVLTLLSISFLLPFVSVLSSSFVGESELIRRGSFILVPEQLNLAAYRVLLSKGSTIYQAYLVTILRVSVGTLLNLLFTATMAYGLAKKAMPGRNVVVSLVFVTMLVEGGLVPSYLLIKGLHLLDTFWVMIVPGLISAWNLIIMRNFFMQLPPELEESATMDGASPLTVLLRVVIPLSLPTFVTIGLFYAVAHWNAWFDATIYINKPALQPLQVFLRRVVLTMTADQLNPAMRVTLIERPTDLSLKSAVIVLTTVPILLVYPFLQKHFVKGVMIGSIKG
ncbi:MAG: carbohydrate ABC transporter permease [Paenibacillaceae bacterium]|nr:carbohydrate ABC transporter permease [Paenibacillaceae bacterium]